MARRIRALTPERVADLSSACICCAFWESDTHAEPRCGGSCDPGRLEGWVREVMSGWGDCGRIVYIDGDAIGFAKYAPARYFPRAAHMAAGAPSEDAVLLACLHVGADARDVGLGKLLLQAVLRDLASRGERAVEAYASTEPLDRRSTPMITVEFLLGQGFTVVRPHPRYPLMRLELKSLAAWTDSIEAVLESLQLPLLRRERVPAPLAGSR